MWIDEPSVTVGAQFYGVVAIVATISSRYGCAILISHTETNKTVPQRPLTFNNKG